MLPDRHAPPASLGATSPVEQRGEAEPEPNSSHPSPYLIRAVVAAITAAYTSDTAREAEPEPNSSHPSPYLIRAVVAGGKLWTEDDQLLADQATREMEAIVSENVYESDDIIITYFAGPNGTKGVQINVREWRTGRLMDAQVPRESFVAMLEALYDRATAKG